MANYRRGRINDEMQRAMAEILRSVKDPRVSEAFISVTGAEVTPDLKFAKIYYSALGMKSAEDKKEIAKGLKSSAGYIRRQVAQRLNLRITPELTFIEDTSITYGAHIAELLNGITFSDDNEEAEEVEEEENDD
jgi:ribosome-binding factor A